MKCEAVIPKEISYKIIQFESTEILFKRIWQSETKWISGIFKYMFKILHVADFSFMRLQIRCLILRHAENILFSMACRMLNLMWMSGVFSPLICKILQNIEWFELVFSTIIVIENANSGPYASVNPIFCVMPYCVMPQEHIYMYVYRWVYVYVAVGDFLGLLLFQEFFKYWIFYETGKPMNLTNHLCIFMQSSFHHLSLRLSICLFLTLLFVISLSISHVLSC